MKRNDEFVDETVLQFLIMHAIAFGVFHYEC